MVLFCMMDKNFDDCVEFGASSFCGGCPKFFLCRNFNRCKYSL